MLRILGSPRSACDGVSRREALRVGALSLFGGITLPRFLEAAARSPGERPGAARAVILLNLFGGPSHLDTFDPKPHAPVEVRGEFKPISTSLPSVHVCEHLPLIARQLHKACLIRTITHPYNSHNPYAVLTGYAGGSDRENYFAKPSDHPSMASVVQYLQGVKRSDLPEYVCMPAPPGYSQGLRRAGPYGGYLGSRFDPLFTRCEPAFARKGAFYDPVVPVGDPMLSALDAQPALTVERLDRRRSLVEAVDRRLATAADSRAFARMTYFQRQAFSLLTSSKTRAAFDLSQEPAGLRDRYGRHLWGSCLLAARRLVEAGAMFIAVNWECAAETHGGHWDMHENNFGMLRAHLPVLDQIYAALIQDLEDRGLLSSTLVIVMGEMGRTPRINRKAGRDHWPQCGFSLLTGGGVRPGLVYGATDPQAAYPKDHPVTPGDLVATIYQLLGVDPGATVPDQTGRPISITHGGSPVREILA